MGLAEFKGLVPGTDSGDQDQPLDGPDLPGLYASPLSLHVKPMSCENIEH